MAILSIMVVNNHGQPRLLKFYKDVPVSQRDSVVRESFQLVSKRPDNVCNFLEGTEYWGKEVRLIYRHYATLYFIFAVDEAESELGILDLIQVFVESLDKCFENVCELDLIFHIDKVSAPPPGRGAERMYICTECRVTVVCRSFAHLPLVLPFSLRHSCFPGRSTSSWTRSSWAGWCSRPV
jgi:AP-3 complex subunit sigma